MVAGGRRADGFVAAACGRYGSEQANKQDSALTQPPTEVWREAATRRSSTGHLIRQTDQSGEGS